MDLIVSEQLFGEVGQESTLSAKEEIRQLAHLSAIHQASDLDEVMDQHQKRLVTLGKERAHPFGSLPCPLRNMASIYIKVNLGMHSACGMDGSSPTHLSSAFVETSLKLTML